MKLKDLSLSELIQLKALNEASRSTIFGDCPSISRRDKRLALIEKNRILLNETILEKIESIEDFDITYLTKIFRD